MTEFEDGGDRAGQVLEVAEAIMLETRSVSLTLNDIADRIGVSRSLLYVYYDGVPAILDAIFQIHLGRLEEHLPLQGDDARPSSAGRSAPIWHIFTIWWKQGRCSS